MKPLSGGYADVNGIKLYHEIYGRGEPMVLIHGGLTTIGEMQEWVKQLAKTRRVIAVEMQGHGHTADTDRPLSFSNGRLELVGGRESAAQALPDRAELTRTRRNSPGRKLLSVQQALVITYDPREFDSRRLH